MAPLVAITHRTAYSFDRPVTVAPHVLRLRPAPSPHSVVLDHRLHISPARHIVHWQEDPFGNHVARVSFLDPMSDFVIEVEIIAELTSRNPFDYLLDPAAALHPFDYGDELSEDLRPHLEVGPPGPLVAGFIEGLDRSERRTDEAVVALGRAVASAVRHEVRTDAGVLSPEETLRRQRGSCRDSAWLLVHVLRHLGLAARFTSGYLVELSSDGDSTDLHAWADVYLPGAGWVGIDPTSGLLTSEGHIPLAVAPYPRGVAPVVGTTEPCEVRLTHSNTVRRLDPSERRTPAGSGCA